MSPFPTHYNPRFRWPQTLGGLHYLAFAILMLKDFVAAMAYVL
ncbi:MAG TPA: hypothetical protein VJ123_07445 [Anaerolineales bacterium]|nr:hypothetical protein [Anaerolineales bacterium]